MLSEVLSSNQQEYNLASESSESASSGRRRGASTAQSPPDTKRGDQYFSCANLKCLFGAGEHRQKFVDRQNFDGNEDEDDEEDEEDHSAGVHMPNFGHRSPAMMRGGRIGPIHPRQVLKRPGFYNSSRGQRHGAMVRARAPMSGRSIARRGGRGGRR